MMMRRREFIAGLGVAAWPLRARAQPARIPIIGFLSGNLAESDPEKRHFLKGLGEAGYVEGGNVGIEYRYSRNASARLPEFAAELVRRPVDILHAFGNAAALSAKAATSTIPTVFSIGGDPVMLGLVGSLARPGGNLTGASFLSTGTTAKMFELLHELAPNADVAALLNPANPTRETETRELQQAARVIGVKLDVLAAGNENDIDAAFVTLTGRRVGALVIQGDPLLSTSKQLVALTLRHGIPAIARDRGFPEAGGLMSYGGSLAEASRIAGVYTGRILNGEKPADLPVQQVTKVEFVINLTTAKAIGLTLPLNLLGCADEVIE